MPTISKIRLVNVVYEEGNKRYNDELFLFDGHNGAILLENGGGKTVLIQTALQAILPHTDLADRKIKSTLSLENAPAHIAIEWIISEEPRRYMTSCVSLFLVKNGLDSIRYVYEYSPNDANRMEEIPFVRSSNNGKRTADKGEMQDYYSQMKEKSIYAQTFATIKEFKNFLEKEYQIVSSQWESIVKINSTEGGVESFFDDCKTTNQLFDRLLIPTVEKSIAGHEENIFADTFENQHTSFKNYKKLKETIEENKQIQQQLETYTASFEVLHTTSHDYYQTKQKAKGLWNTILEQKQCKEDEKFELMNKIDETEKELRSSIMKQASYQILVEEKKLNRFDQEYKTAKQTEAEIEDDVNEQRLSLYSLQYAELSKKISEELSFIEQLEREIEDINNLDDIQEFMDKRDEKRQHLLGYFLKKIEQIQSSIQELRFELQPLEQNRDQAKARQTSLEGNKQEKRDLFSKVCEALKIRKEDLRKLEQQLLANPKQEKVVSELEKWKLRYQWLDEEIIRVGQEDKRLVRELIEKEEMLEALKEKKTSLENHSNELKLLQSISSKAHQQMVTKLGALRPQWHNLDQLYLKQQTVEAMLHEQIQARQKEKQQLLYKERIAYRFVDDYLEQNQFFGDPFLEQQLSIWKNQIDYITTGVEFLQELEEKDRKDKLSFPLWPVTLITTSKSKPELRKKLIQVEDRLLFPIIVLTLEEALEIDRFATTKDWIAPKHWHHNLDGVSFQQWQNEIENKANQALRAREHCEVELKQWQTVLHELSHFLETHPYEEIQQRHKELAQLANEIESVKVTCQELIREIDQQKSYREDLQTKLVNYRDEKQGLETKMEKAYLYLKHESEIKELDIKKWNMDQELTELDGLIKSANREFQRFSEECTTIEVRIQELKFQLTSVENDDAFKVIQSLTPIYTNETRNVIEEAILQLDYKIRQISQTHNELEEKKKGKLALIKNFQEQQEDLKSAYPSLEEKTEFPEDGPQLIKLLRETVKEMQLEWTELREVSARKLATFMEQNGVVKNKREIFQKQFPNQEPIAFGHTLEETATLLETEANELNKRRSYLTQEFSRITKELENIDKAQRSLEKYVEAHKFLSPDIELMEISVEDKQNFTYQRASYVEALAFQLNTHKEEVEKIKQDVAKAKQRFREFCNNKITDIKMRNMALNGIEYKASYEDILQFKKNMMISVERATSYANEHIRQKDIELQAFINQIHSHLQTVVDELKQIPKKTRVKVDDDWKQIYTFTIPEWTEEDGKTRIRDHIEWILTSLEQDKFITEQGTEDQGKIRQEIEKWLETKQLIRIILSNQALKVNCRKVTNDNKVTTRSYSWEQSNVWSGGEKWSKNMTLFLGILNYVAEKKQHSNSKMKRSSSVILDNPFGKASSDHVLNPVFFVAEQLGFQIIALTAHAEGKFLQDYFPVIYSCRLRASNDASKKIMTKEKWLHHAYFQDHEPQTIDRLGQTEQLALFE